MTYAEAIEDILQKAMPSKRRLMEAFMADPDHTLSVDEITRLLKYEHWVGANGIVGQFGRQVYERTKGAHPDGYAPSTYQFQSFITTQGAARDTSYSFRLRPHMVEALRELGIGGSDDPVVMPEELVPDSRDSIVEGAVRSALVNAFERDPRARLRCLAHYGYECACCGLNMKELYGLVEEFAHVHHLKPLAGIRRSYVVDPILDLRPVCPNCHSVIHLSKPVLNVEEVRRMLGLVEATAVVP